MAFFSLLNPEDGAATGDYEAERCHINVWSLPGWLGHRPMLLDVGLIFTPTSELRAIEMALPVRATPRIRDLVGTIGQTGVGTLLFGKSFDSVSPGELKLKLNPQDSEDLTTLKLIGVDERKSEFVHEDNDLVAVKLALVGPAASGETAYIRTRFVVDHSATMWRWQRVLGRRDGVLIDFRVPDPREERQHDRTTIESRAKPLQELDAFFMLPERFRLQAANPELKYTRTLEGRAWHPYLRRSVNGASALRPGHQRLMVHRWHPERVDGSPKPVGREHPFRGFLQFHREPAFRAPSDLALTGLLTAAILWALFRPLSLRDGFGNQLNWAGDRLAAVIHLGLGLYLTAGVFVVASAIYTAVARWKKLPKLYRRAKRIFKRAEYKWFEIWK
jgi:hypothetical protein